MSAVGAVVGALFKLLVGIVGLIAVALLGPAFLLDTPQPAPRASDAIVVISGTSRPR